jgi:hypothetical protein
VHSDEVSHVVACPKFENAQIIARTAMLLLILHLPPPSLGCTAARQVAPSQVPSVSAQTAGDSALLKFQLQEKKLVLTSTCTDPDILTLEEFAASTEATSNTPLGAVDVAGTQLGGARQSPSRLNSSSGC